MRSTRKKKTKKKTKARRKAEKKGKIAPVGINLSETRVKLKVWQFCTKGPNISLSGIAVGWSIR